MVRVVKRRGFTLVELLVVIAIIGILVGLLLPAVQAAREAARRMSCSNNLKQFGLAMLNYESAHKSFPYGSFPHQAPGWGNTYSQGSQMVKLLPFMEQTALYNARSGSAFRKCSIRSNCRHSASGSALMSVRKIRRVSCACRESTA